jgi:hypothetical protein
MVSREKCDQCKENVERKEVTRHDGHDEIVLTCGHKYTLFRRNITEHIISNPYVERDITDNFVCKLHFQDHNELNVQTDGMDPFAIWNEVGYRAFDQNVVPIIVDQLISNNVNRRFIDFNPSTKRVSITNEGRHWAKDYCRSRAVALG